MTATPAHLDDETLSALLDGLDDGARAAAHLDGCATCSARLTVLGEARDAVREAVVAPLAPDVLADLVVGALAGWSEGGPASTSPRGPRVEPVGSARRRGRRVQTPPPTWVLGAAAALAVVVGMAGLLRVGGSARDDRASSTSSEAAEEVVEGEAAAGTSAATGASVDPELVTRDLGELADTGALAGALGASAGAVTTTGAAQATAAPAGAAATSEERAAPVSPAPATDAGGGTAAADFAGPPDRAQCRTDAERIGAGRFGTLVTTATLRWVGQPAEVLVFTLVEPAGGFSRQALVLARPGCALLADPRW